MSNESSKATTAIPDFTSGTWRVDPAHSGIAFSVRQLVVTKVRGRFTRYEVTITTGSDPVLSSVDATIELASLDTGNEKRDEHIRSDAFFDVAKYPTASYHSTGVRRAGEGWTVDGDLTFRGITRSVPLTVTAAEFSPGPNGGQRAVFSATASVVRSEFGIDGWTGGGLVVSDKVPIQLDIQATR